MDFVNIDSTDSNNPDEKHTQDNPDDIFTFLSTKFPPNAADIPKKKIASENANSISDTSHVIICAISSLRSDQQ
jgi:hypothetical protein